MSEPHFIINELTAYQLLDALCICSRHVTDFNQILVETTKSEFHHYYDLCYPSNHSDAKIKTQLDAITSILGRMYNLSQAGHALKSAKHVDLGIIINTLMYQDRNDVIDSDDDIYESTTTDTPNSSTAKLHRSTPIETEQLLILPSKDPKLIEEVGNGLRLTKVGFKFASSEKNTFFHLTNEIASRADPLTYLSTKLGKNCILIGAHNVAGNRIFAPKDQILYQEKLQCFVELATFLHPAKQVSNDRPFAALVPYMKIDGQKTPQRTAGHLNLCNLRWHSPIALEPVENEHYQIEIHDYAKMESFDSQQHNPHDNKDWRERMGFEDTSTGYKVNLVEAPKTISSNKAQIDKQRKKIRRERDELNYQLTYLDSIQLKSPILRRFTQSQLSQLADFLRSFPITTIKEGRIKYCFSQTDRDEAGLHYFMYDPGNAIIEAFDAFRTRDEEDNRCTRFCIDPLWDSVYHNNAQHKIYVPEGKVMHPPLHGWRSSEMDQYMRTIMAVWFPELPGSSQSGIPENPLYIFEYSDGEGGTTTNPILVSILDEQKFEPFHERLGFFNANLELIYEQSTQPNSVAVFIVEMAEKSKRKDMLEQMRIASSDAQIQFEEVANTTAQNMADTFNRLLDVFTDKSQAMQDEITQITDDIRQQNNQLMQLSKLVESMKQFGLELKTEDSALQTNLKQIDQTVEKITKKVNLYIEANLNIKKKRIDQKVTDVVDELKTRHYRLSQKISSLWD